jgi:ABC-type lipoprotein release transport system permease subunit
MIEDPGRVERALEGVKGVGAYSIRVNLRGLLSSAENSGGVQVFGIEPEREKHVTLISEKIKAGEYLAPGDTRGVLIGTTLSEDLESGLGDKLVLMTQALDGSLSAELFRVRGIFESGSPQFDEAVIYITKEAAQALVEMGDSVTEFAVIAVDSDAVEGAVAELLNRPETQGLEVLSWKELSPHLVQMMEMENTGLFIVLAIIFTIVAIGVINTMLMSVMDRIKEFGVMLSLGTRPRHIVTIIITEAFFLGILGLAFGLVLGFSIVYYYSLYGIDLSSFSEALSTVVPGETVIYPAFSPVYTVISSIAVLVTAIAASLYPAYKACRLKPVEALRYI